MRKRNKAKRSETGKSGLAAIRLIRNRRRVAVWAICSENCKRSDERPTTRGRSSMPSVSARAARVAALVLAAAVSGCGPKVSAENYDKIANGMKEDRVAGILGIASESRNATVKLPEGTFTSTLSKWRNDKGTILVEFLNSEVQSKQYFPPGTEPKASRHY